MTTVDRLVRYISRAATGEYGHGAKAIERSGKKAIASRTNVAQSGASPSPIQQGSLLCAVSSFCPVEGHSGLRWRSI